MFIFIFISIKKPLILISTIMREMEKLVTGLTEALQGCRFTTSRPVKLHKCQCRPTLPDDPTLKEWLEDVEFYCAQAHIPESQQPSVILAHLEGSARVEVRCHSGIDKDRQNDSDIGTVFWPQRNCPIFTTGFLR